MLDENLDPQPFMAIDSSSSYPEVSDKFLAMFPNIRFWIVK